MRYMLTHSGQRVSRTHGAPTIEDVALGLSRAARFAGQGRCAWSVLQHSLFVEALAQQHACLLDEARDGIKLRLIALLHDAHEAVTGDVPTPLKTLSQHDLQEELDERLFPALAPELTLKDHRTTEDEIARFDQRALLAEACVVGPPILQTPDDVREHFGEAPYDNDVAACCRMLGSQAGLSPEGLQKVFVARYYALRTMLHATPVETSLERTRAIMESINESLATGARS